MCCHGESNGTRVPNSGCRIIDSFPNKRQDIHGENKIPKRLTAEAGGGWTLLGQEAGPLELTRTLN